MSNDWSEELEAQIKYIGECSAGFLWMYKRDTERYTRLYTNISKLSILTGLISGILQLTSITSKILNEIIIFTTILTLGTSTAQTYLHNMEYETTIADLKRLSSKYSGLLNNIKRQLSLPPDKRERAIDYHRWITQNYDDLRQTILNIHPDTITEYKQHCKDKGIQYPDEDTKIEVYVDAERNKSNLTLQEAVQFSDSHMQYEISRLQQD